MAAPVPEIMVGSLYTLSGIKVLSCSGSLEVSVSEVLAVEYRKLNLLK
jgi:hypothetical protein